MIYVCNFYAHKKEAISVQLELLRRHTDGYLFAAGIFLNQQHLSYEDLSEKRIILSESEFSRTLPRFIKSLPKSEAVHYFSEEAEADKLKIFNSVHNDLYISMYRRPTRRYATFLRKLKHLARIYVELDSHKDILLGLGMDPKKIIVSHPPAIFKRSFSVRKFTGKFLFASWNGGDLRSLTGRGLIAILDFLKLNAGAVCNVLLRDSEVDLYKKIIHKKRLDDRAIISDINSYADLRNAFINTDAVLFLMQRKLTKDVPNSIIDGIALGKPVIMTNVVDFAETVKDHDIGWVVDPGEVLDMEKIKTTYGQKSRNAFRYSKEFTLTNYIEKIVSGYKK